MSSPVMESHNPVTSTPQIVTPVSRRAITPAHTQAMALKFQGLSYTQIAAKILVPAGTLRNWFAVNGSLYEEYQKYCNSVMNATETAKKIQDESRTVAETIKSAAPGAIQTIIDLSSNAKREQVRLGASIDILDRAGYAPVQKNINIHAIEEMSATELDAMVTSMLARDEAQIASKPKLNSINTHESSALPIYSDDSSTLEVADLTITPDLSLEDEYE